MAWEGAVCKCVGVCGGAGGKVPRVTKGCRWILGVVRGNGESIKWGG